VEYDFVRDALRLPEIAREIERSRIVGMDIETTSFEPFHLDKHGRPSRIRLLSLNTGVGVYVIDFDQTGGPGPVLQALASEDVIKVIQNAKFEQKWFLYKYNVELWPIFDTYRASVLIHNGRDLDHDIWQLYERELQLAPTTEDLGGSDWTKPNLSKDQIDYSAEDTVHLLRLRDSLKPKLKKFGLFEVALLEFGAILPEAAVELNGLYLDRDMWLELAVENERRAEALRRSLVWKLPNPKNQATLPGIEPGLNLQSPIQVLNSLRRLGGSISALDNTREITLAMFAAQYPIVKELLEYRTYAQRVKSFGEEYLRHIDPNTGRVHSNYFPFTGAGRYACCVPKRSRVATSKGLVPIGGVRPGDLVQTAEGPRKVLSWTDSGEKPVRRLTLSDGRQVDYTAEHMVLSDGRWKCVGDLQEGDVLYISGTSAPSPEIPPTLPKGETSRSRNKVHFPEKLTEDVAFILGHYIAKGCIGFNKQRSRKRIMEGAPVPVKVIVAFGHEEGELRAFVKSEWERLFGVSPRVTDGTSPTLYFSSVAVGEWLQRAGCGGLAAAKRIPPAVWPAPNKVKLSFLQGLFEGDAGSTAGYPRLATESPVLASEVGELLASLGIHYSITRSEKGRKGVKSVVTVLAQSSRHSADLFWSSSKKNGCFEKKRKRLCLTGVEPPTFFDGISIYDRARDITGWEKFSQSWFWKIKKRERLTINKLEAAATVATSNSATDRFIRFALDADLRSVRIAKIETLPEEPVCDIEVDGNQQFLLNGVVTHNSSPNLQQIPRDKAFRKCFRAPPGKRIVAADYCVDPAMRLLTEDLRWVPAGDVKEGDRLIGFDEDLRSSKMKTTVVVRTKRIRKPRYRVTMGSGTILTVSDNHSWVKRREWVRTDELKVGDCIEMEGESFSTSVVRGIARIEDGEVVAIETTTHTFVCEGFLSHNSNIEMRLAAQIANDLRLIAIFNSVDDDAHRATAALLASKDPREVTKGERQEAKPVNFGLTRIITEHGLMPIERVGIGVRVLTHRGNWKRVVDTQNLSASKLVRLTTRTGKVVSSTEDHMWYTIRQNWVRAEDLEVGQCLVGRDEVVSGERSGREEIVRIEPIFGDIAVYDLTVEDDHSFVAEDLVTHNCYGMREAKLVMYAMSNYGVAMSLETAKRYRERFFGPDGYAGIAKWHDYCINVQKPKGYTKTLGGRIRYLKEDAHNEYYNSPVQGCNRLESLVFTSKGYKTIERVLGEGGTGRVWTGTSWAPFELLYKGEAEAADIFLSDGTVIRCDTRHKVMEVRDEGYRWLDFDDIQKGVKIATSLCLPIDSLELSESLPFHETGLIKEDMYRQLGARLCGDIVNDEPTGALSIRVPAPVQSESLACRVAFLEGVTASDCCTTDTKVAIVRSEQREFLEGLKLVFRSVGVESKLRGPYRYKDRIGYRLDVHNDMWKKAQGLPVEPVISMKAPRFILEELKSRSPIGLPLHLRSALSRVRGGGNVSVYTAKAILDDTGGFSEPVYGFRRVLRVERLGKIVPTYTLNVDDPLHRFDTEGVITKNSGADGLKRALRNVYFRLKKISPWNGAVKMIHHVHDEILTEIDDDDELDLLVRRELSDGMCEGMARYVTKLPVKVEPESGASWGEAKT